MQKQKVQFPTVTLVGLTARTNNKNEINPATSKIGGLASVYWGNQIADSIKHRANPGVTYAVYTDFESDENGDYTYFIGEAVRSLESQDLIRFKTIQNHYNTSKSVSKIYNRIWSHTKHCHFRMAENMDNE